MKSTITAVAYAALTKSPLNVRDTKADDPSIGELAASILSKGLIQPIAVHAVGKRKGMFGVLAGERRWRAIGKLLADGATFDFDSIPVNLLEGDDAELTEISLAENYVRKGMRPPEIYAAFRAIRERNPAITNAELAEHYGIDPARVARIMRLAFLHPTVFKAYEQGSLTDEQAFAYAATEDQALQLSVYERLLKAPKHDRYPRDIRQAMKVGSGEHRQMLAYVGLEAYQAAGGVFEQDLFADEANSGRVMHEDTLLRLVNEKMAIARDAFERLLERNGRRFYTDGPWGIGDLQFSWAEQPPQVRENGYTTTDHQLQIAAPRRGKLDAEIEAKAKTLTARKAAIGAEIMNARGTDDEAEKIEQLRKENASASAELDAIDAQRTIILPKKGAVVGIARLDNSNRLQVVLYYASRKEKGVAEPADGRSKAAVQKSPEEKQRLAWGLNKDPMQAMLMLRRDMIREQLLMTSESGLALDFLLYSQGRAILRPSGKTWDGKPVIDGAPLGIATPAAQDKPPATIARAYEKLSAASRYREAFAQLADSDWATTADAVEGFALFRAADAPTKHAVAAIVAGYGLLSSTSLYGDGRTPRMVEDLACIAEMAPGRTDWAETVDYDEAFFETITHKARIALLVSWGLEDHAKLLKKATSADFCARVMKAAKEHDQVELGKIGVSEDIRAELSLWRPEWLDTQMVGALPADEPEAEAASDSVDTDAEDDLAEDNEEAQREAAE